MLNVIDAFDVHSNRTSVSAQRFCSRFIACGHNVIICIGDGKGEFDTGKFNVPFFQDIIDEQQGSMIAKPDIFILF